MRSDITTGRNLSPEGPGPPGKYGRQVFIGQEARCQRVRRGGVLFSGEWQVGSPYRNRRCRTLLRIGPSSDQVTHFTPGRHRQSNVRTDHAGIVTSRGIGVQQAITGACAAPSMVSLQLWAFVWSSVFSAIQLRSSDPSRAGDEYSDRKAKYSHRQRHDQDLAEHRAVPHRAERGLQKGSGIVHGNRVLLRALQNDRPSGSKEHRDINRQDRNGEACASSAGARQQRIRKTG